ncbi:MAG TPA: hypothetical protein PLP61_02890 [Nocardioides sp.]|uniref:hypothetical protein n=1 Tax=Nocardioides sp. TaxID=35761 RepID=UPI002C8A3235|nr:hypothetical protein [Nocardioides sp.]HQR25963.1 hypothetical protein [Nocardioides sp.]
MPELEQLRRLSGEVHPPAFESLVKVAGRRDRRATVSVALASFAAVVAVVVGGLLAGHPGEDRPQPAPSVPTPSPTKPDKTGKPSEEAAHVSETSMTPQEVVLADDATLVLTGVSADDPDFRVSAWRATCHWCPRSEVGRPSFTALAITSDGYARTTYRRAPFESGLEHVESPGPGLLLIVDAANGYEWLVRDDGTITPLARDFDDAPAADPRLWFVCLASTGHTSAGGAIPQDAPLTWCMLDPAADAVHVRRGPWEGTGMATGIHPSVVSPGSGDLLWGVQDQLDDRLVAWWLADGTRHYQDLGPSTGNGAVLNSPPGTMAFWSWVKGAEALSVFTSDDRGSTWQRTDLGVSFRPDDYYFALAWTPAGDLVGRQDDAFFPPSSIHLSEGIRLWRADLVEGGSFVLVHEARTGNEIAIEDPAFAVLGDRIWASRLWSDDDGRTWVEQTTWR